jgi:exodeoxyribonuclease VII small subunit
VGSLFGSSEEGAGMDTDQPGRTKPAQPAGRAAAEATAEEAETGQRFEESYRRLEELVAEMERGDLPLEELLTRFEEGVQLVKHCRGFLKQAQLRVEQYIEQRDGHWVLKDLE